MNLEVRVAVSLAPNHALFPSVIQDAMVRRESEDVMINAVPHTSYKKMASDFTFKWVYSQIANGP